MKRTSVISVERVKTSRRNRFNPIKGLTPEKLVSALDEFSAGYLSKAALLFDRMVRRDPILRVVSQKRVKNPARCPFQILTLEDSPKAREHAAALRWFYNNISVTNAFDPNERGGFSLLVRQMLSAVGMRYAVHEFVWKPKRSNGAEIPASDDGKEMYRPDTLLTAEFRFCPLWWFEAHNGPLAYLPTDTTTEGLPLQPGEWLTTVGDGLMEPCAVAYVFKNLSLHDWIIFNEKFGMPGILGRTTGGKDSPEWEAMEEAVASIVSDWAGVCSAGDAIDLLETKGNGTTPYEPLVERMDRYMATVWRGGDLSTISSKDGQGTGASLQGGEEALLTEDDCQLATETLNEQVDRSVLMYLFGEDPLAYIKIIPPKQLNLDATIKKAEFLADRGVGVGVSQLREDLGVAEPAEGEELLGKKADAQAVAPNPQAGLENESTMEAVSRDHLTAALAEDLALFRNRLKAISEISDETLFRQKLTELRDQWEQMVKDTLADPRAAQALANISTAELFNGMDAARKERKAV